MTKTFDSIPLERPETPLLDTINNPSEMRSLGSEQLLMLADELRSYLLFSVGQSGGHFGAGLGAVELTIALHYIFDTPEDKLVWDVGHQAYPHKILTGRREELTTIRKAEGLSPFPHRRESKYDTFGVGHSSTSISAALGMALASKLKEKNSKTIAIIGDGAMSAGMAYEAMNNAGALRSNLIVVLNDNDMSIARPVGAMSKYLAKLLSGKLYFNFRETVKMVISAFSKKPRFFLFEN